MIIISHRGNLAGIVPDKENHPEYIDKAISEGFDVEIDIRVITNVNNTNQVYLGHDNLEHLVSNDWLLKRKNNLWLHCKNLQAAHYLKEEFKCFGSDKDPFCYMSQGYIWVNDTDIKPPPGCVVPLLGLEDIKTYRFMQSAYAICTDYPMKLERNIGCKNRSVL